MGNAIISDRQIDSPPFYLQGTKIRKYELSVDDAAINDEMPMSRESVSDVKEIRCLNIHDVNEAQHTIHKSPLVRATPLLSNAHLFLDLDNCNFALHLKMENLQNSGSCKIRGIVNQFANLPTKVLKTKKHFVCACDRNFALAFAVVALHHGFFPICLLPATVGPETLSSLKKLNVEHRTLSSDPFDVIVDEYSDDPLVHIPLAYEDLDLLGGYATLAQEILAEVSKVDIVLVSCGTGGLLSGIAAGFKLKKCKCRVYGVEPENACNVYECLRQNRPLDYTFKPSIATGLQSNFTGPLTLEHCRQFVDGILKVSEQDITSAVLKLYTQGFVVEPSGAAPLAACLAGKVPKSRSKVVVAILSGRNMSTRELYRLPSPSVMGVTEFPKVQTS